MRWQLLDRIVECDAGKRALGIKCFTRSESFFQDHFPGMPIVPGVLQIEMIAQLAGKCIAMARTEVLPVIGSVKGAKFYQSIRPGDQCFIHIEVKKIAQGYALADGFITVNNERVSSAEIFFGLTPRERLSSESFDDVTRDFKAREKEKTLQGSPEESLA
jgi:3-hydroxyacyl-[acyl-carrier-protein] dehydratase